ncbi:uncharacterized protein LOC142162967 [Nicotiana tabacum]|uniref:Uncharacterized protein LOC142162967 n=1 Tax=Nicotiana tabacum TaxID=4097 RepID=A0AC58RUD8_TOBAC
MKDLWDELDILAPLPSCDYEKSRPYVDNLVRQRLLQFLMGLNESYSKIRSNILQRRPVLAVNQAYSAAVQEESRRALGEVETNKDPLTMLAGRGQMFKGKKPGLIYEHCGYKGHLKDNCYKIIGYPADFKSKKKGQPGGYKPCANNVNAEGEANVKVQILGSFMTEEHYKYLVNLLTKSSIGEGSVAATSSSNMAGTMSLLSSISNNRVYDWIMDICASHHIAFCKEVLESLKEIEVSKLTKELFYLAAFYLDFCMFQGLYNDYVLGIGREDSGLYILRRE